LDLCSSWSRDRALTFLPGVRTGVRPEPSRESVSECERELLRSLSLASHWASPGERSGAVWLGTLPPTPLADPLTLTNSTPMRCSSASSSSPPSASSNASKSNRSKSPFALLMTSVPRLFGARGVAGLLR
jgi:hypothetical protein